MQSSSMRRARSCVLLVLALGVASLPSHLAAQTGGGRAEQPSSTRDVTGESVPAITEARRLLEFGRPVTASRTLARALGSSRLSGPEAVLELAATYAAWRAWPSVDRVLAGQDWLDTAAGGRGLRLYARARLELGDAASAARGFAEYLAGVGSPAPLEARVHLARALIELGEPDGAATQLERAATEHPALGEWLRLSALQARARARDREGVARLAERLAGNDHIPRDSLLAPRIELAFAAGEPAEALSLLGDAGERLRDRFAHRIGQAHMARGDTSAALRVWRTGLETRRPAAELGPAVLALDRSWSTLRDVGAGDLRAGRSSRGVAHLLEARDLAPAGERAGLDETIARTHRSAGASERALAVLQPWLDSPSPRRHASLLLLASQLYRSLGQTARADRALAAAAAGSGTSAAFASYLIADADHDEGRLEAARHGYERTIDSFPRTSYGERSLVRLAMLHFLEGRYSAARARLEEFRRRYASSEWEQGAVYWTGRALEAEGDSAGARALFVETLQADPLDYYGNLAAARLGRSPWEHIHLRDDPPRRELETNHRSLLLRMSRLRDLGWPERARREFATEWDGSRDAATILALARALNAAGWTQEGIRLGYQARTRLRGWSRGALEAVYPLPYREALVSAAADRGLEPSLVAGLTRRESLFDHEIISVANAVGLMQLLPRTAQDMARRAGIPEYTRPQLTVPEVNILLGTRYLADVLGRFGGRRIAGMVSYNAGPHRWIRWREFAEASDDELFVERIPFRETREYARAVTELTAIYQYLYAPWSTSDGASPGSP